MEVAFDENVIQDVGKSPIFVTFQCFNDYTDYNGEGVTMVP
jgi:hypothetical protein